MSLDAVIRSSRMSLTSRVRMTAAAVVLAAACTPIPPPEASQPVITTVTARRTLTVFFEAVSTGRYAEAAELYGGSYEILQGWNAGVDPADGAGLLRAGCEINGLQCLPARSITGVAQLETRFTFDVTFRYRDGGMFVRGPCCGADATQMPPVSVFTYTVVWTDAGFRVLDLPPYVP